MPCHHPKWPMRCPKCAKNALGFVVTVPVERRWDPETKEMQCWAWRTTGVVCFTCMDVIVAWPEDAEKHVSQDYVRVIVRTDLVHIGEVRFVKPSVFNIACRLPAEEAEDAQVHTQ